MAAYELLSVEYSSAFLGDGVAPASSEVSDEIAVVDEDSLRSLYEADKPLLVEESSGCCVMDVYSIIHEWEESVL